MILKAEYTQKRNWCEQIVRYKGSQQNKKIFLNLRKVVI